MPINITWDDEAKTIILCTIEDDFASPTAMADAFSQVGALAKTVEHEVGVIMDWTQFQLFIPDPKVSGLPTEGRRGILRGDFGSSDTTTKSRIAITVLVFSEAISKEVKTVFSQMINITNNQGRFVIASSIDEARGIISNHFRQGNAD